MADDRSHPLTDEHYSRLKAVCASCARVSATLEKATAAGLPTDEAKAENENNRKLAEGLLRSFFPHKP